MIRNSIKQKILEKVIFLEKFGLNDLTWEKEAAKHLIVSLFEDDIGILGGSVYKIDYDRLIPMYDNWSCNPKLDEPRKEYCFRSKTEALHYITKYPVYPNEKILFSLVFTDSVE